MGVGVSVDALELGLDVHIRGNFEFWEEAFHILIHTGVHVD